MNLSALHPLYLWSRFWMRFAGLGSLGRFATCFASWFTPPYKARSYLARLNPWGYISPRAVIYHPGLHNGHNVFIGDRVVIFCHPEGGIVEIGDRVHLHNDTIIEVGSGGSLRIGADTHIQPRCQFAAFKGSIEIGRNVQIAPACAFYSYNHACERGKLIQEQPLVTKGGILIEDDVWLGYGVIVLDGVRVGRGAVVGAGSVVTHDVPPDTIVVGSPAHVIRVRSSATQDSL
jgi:acetyltransferase-like isoleucine patch superfamily enzyme